MVNSGFYSGSRLFVPVDFAGQKACVQISRVTEHPIHFHDCTELIFVLSGTVKVRISYETFTLEKHDFILINDAVLHSIYDLGVEDEAVLAIIHFGDPIRENNQFVWDIRTLKNQRIEYDYICDNIMKCIQAVYIENKPWKHGEQYLDNVIGSLKENFKMVMYPFGVDKNENNDVALERLDGMLDYVYDHFDEHITLERLSKQFNVSRYYLSHFIKATTGSSFKSILNIIRAEQAEFYLLDNGKMPLNEICHQVGFSSPKYFNKAFQTVFGDSPAVHRRKYQKETVAHKSFREEPYRVRRSDLFLSQMHKSSDAAEDDIKLKIKLESDDCYISVLHNDAEGDELTIVIKRKK